MTDDLRERLRHADPAASLRPIAPEAVSRLLENVMTTTSTTRPRLLLVAAAATLALSAVSAAALMLGGGPGRTSDPVAAPTAGPMATPGQPTVGQHSITKLSTDSTDGLGKCAAPQAARLAAIARLAFEGTVLRIERGVVTLQVTHVWTGVKTDLVEVAQTEEHTAALLAGTVLKLGQTYLIAATDGRVLSCGYSGLADPQLRALYDAAF